MLSDKVTQKVTFSHLCLFIFTTVTQVKETFKLVHKHPLCSKDHFKKKYSLYQEISIFFIAQKKKEYIFYIIGFKISMLSQKKKKTNKLNQHLYWMYILLQGYRFFLVVCFQYTYKLLLNNFTLQIYYYLWFNWYEYIFVPLTKANYKF